MYHIHEILYFGGDWSDLSLEIDEIFGVNHGDSDGDGHSGGDTVEVGSLLLSDHISELPIEGNVESTQAPKSVREIVRKTGWFITRYKMWLATCSFIPN